MDPEVAAALESLRSALARTQGRRLLYLHLVYSTGQIDVLSVPQLPDGAARPPDEPARPHQTNRPAVEQAILAALAGAAGPLKGSAVAARVGRSYTSYFREVLSRLCAEGVVARDRETGGYVLARPEGNSVG